jgi:hypothetical protein
MACQAIVCSWFWIFFARCLERACGQKKGESNSRRKKVPYCSRGHALTRQSFWFNRFSSGRRAAFLCFLLRQATDVSDETLDLIVFQLAVV